jgi:hypothetical protein
MKKAERLIVFFVPEEKLVNGGIVSIFSICKVSREFEDIHKSKVVLSMPPGVKSYGKNDLFENDETIYSFDEIIAQGSPKALILHIPEYASYNTFMALKKHSDYLQAIPELQINIMNQNILLMQPPEEVGLWFSLTPHVTQTTAHNKYSTQELADRYAIPTHHLSTYVDSSQYTFTPYKNKKKLIALSPDQSKMRTAIEKKLKTELPDYSVVTVKNLSYEDYKKFIGTARYIITFGEGFDNYYIEGFYTGGVSFVVYNEEFFPDSAFAGFENTYASEATLLASIVEDIKRLDSNQSAYEKINSQNLARINKLYSFSNYRNNIKLFYQKKYKLMPRPGSVTHLLGRVITHNEKVRMRDHVELTRLQQAVSDMEKMIAAKSQSVIELDAKILEMEQSKSWKVTKPLRKASAIVKH